MKNCLICKKKLNRQIKFCSLKCLGVWLSQNRKGTNNPAWGGGQIIKNRLPPDVVFIGYQRDIDGNDFPLFNVIKSQHPAYGSTVSRHTLRELGLRIPKIKRK